MLLVLGQKHRVVVAFCNNTILYFMNYTCFFHTEYYKILAD